MSISTFEMAELHLFAEFLGRNFGHGREQRAELFLVHEPLVQEPHMCTS